MSNAIGHSAKDTACACYFMGITIFVFGCHLAGFDPAIGAIQMILGMTLAIGGALNGGMAI